MVKKLTFCGGMREGLLTMVNLFFLLEFVSSLKVGLLIMCFCLAFLSLYLNNYWCHVCSFHMKSSDGNI